MARDQYVRVVYAGYLFPFGHRASLVKVTERKFFFNHHSENPGFVAYLFQRMFIIVRERERTYTHRAIPFRTITLKTRVTPNLADPTQSQVTPHGQSAFWPRVVAGAGIVDFPFQVSATDWEGRESKFQTPLIFVDRNVDETAIDSVIAHYQAAAQEPRRKRAFSG